MPTSAVWNGFRCRTTHAISDRRRAEEPLGGARTLLGISVADNSRAGMVVTMEGVTAISGGRSV